MIKIKNIQFSDHWYQARAVPLFYKAHPSHFAVWSKMIQYLDYSSSVGIQIIHPINCHIWMHSEINYLKPHLSSVNLNNDPKQIKNEIDDILFRISKLQVFQ